MWEWCTRERSACRYLRSQAMMCDRNSGIACNSCSARLFNVNRTALDFMFCFLYNHNWSNRRQPLPDVGGVAKVMRREEVGQIYSPEADYRKQINMPSQYTRVEESNIRAYHPWI